MAVENLLRGYVRAELFAIDGAYLGNVELRLGDIPRDAETKTKVVLPAKVRVGKLQLVL